MDDKVVLDLCSDAIIVLDTHANVTKFNKMAGLIFNIKEKEIIGFNFFSVVEEHNVELFLTFDNIKLIAKRKDNFVENNIFSGYKNNNKYTILWRINRYCFGNKNQEYFSLVGKDISEIYSYKNSLQNNSIYLKSIIENLPQYVYWKDRNFVYQGCNNLVAQYLGLNSPLEIVGKTDRDFKWDTYRINFLHKIDDIILTQGTPNVIEDSLPKEDGSFSVMLTSKTPLRDDNGEIIGILGISFDITDRKLMEENLRCAQITAEAANQAKTEFLANMRHDIRTPLSGIVGFSEILKSEVSDPRIKEYADNLIASSHALLGLMDEVLEAIKVSSGEIPLLKKKFSLADTLTSITQLYAAKASEKNWIYLYLWTKSYRNLLLVTKFAFTVLFWSWWGTPLILLPQVM